MPGLISCPFCDYCEILSESDMIFECRNVQCAKQSCRKCRQVNHLPVRCVESGLEYDQTRLRKMVEEKLTLALARQCHRCKKLFLKTDGCNKMVSAWYQTCQTWICIFFLFRLRFSHLLHFYRYYRFLKTEGCDSWLSVHDIRLVSDLTFFFVC